MNQRDRVLRLLRERGGHGLNTTDLHLPACDGGKPIIRLAARVHELQRAGYGIRSERKLDGTATYVLIRDLEEVSTATASAPTAAAPTAADLLGAPAERAQRTAGHAGAALSSCEPLAETEPGGSLGSLFDADQFAAA